MSESKSSSTSSTSKSPASFTSLPLEVQQRVFDDLGYPPLWPWVASPAKLKQVRRTLIRACQVSRQFHHFASPLIARLVHIDGAADADLLRRFLYECIRRPSLGADVFSFIFTRSDLPQTHHQLVLLHLDRFPNLIRIVGLPLSPALFDDLLVPPPAVRPKLIHLTIHQSDQHLDEPTVLTRWLDLSALRILTVKGEAEIPLDVSGLMSGGNVRDLTLMSVFVRRPFAPFFTNLCNTRHLDMEYTNLSVEDVQSLLYAAPNLRNLVLPAAHPVVSLARLSHRRLQTLALPAAVKTQDATEFASRFARRRMPLLEELAFSDLDVDEDQLLEADEGESEVREGIERVLRGVGLGVDWLAT